MKTWGILVIILLASSIEAQQVRKSVTVVPPTSGTGAGSYYTPPTTHSYEQIQQEHVEELKAAALRGDSQAMMELQIFHPKEAAVLSAGIEAERKRQAQIDFRNKMAANPTWRSNEHELVDLLALKTKALTEMHKLERTGGDTNQIENLRHGIKSIDSHLAILQQRKKAIEGK